LTAGKGPLSGPPIWKLLSALVLVGLVLGVGAALIAYSAFLPQYLGRVLLFGVIWGLAWILVTVALGALMWWPSLAFVRRRLERTFPPGSVTEVELAEDCLVLRRPTGVRSIPYRSITRVRADGRFQTIALRGRPFGEVLPSRLLPADAIALIELRRRGLSPSDGVPATGQTRRVVVPLGWAGHAAGVSTLALLGTARPWTRLGLLFLVTVPIAVAAGLGWLLVSPGVALLVWTGYYLQTRHAVAAVLPAGTTASTEFLDDRFITRNALGQREVRYDEVESAETRRDLVLLRMAAGGTLLIARALVPDEALSLLGGPPRRRRGARRPR
jgi:hypothetical protein